MVQVVYRDRFVVEEPTEQQTRERAGMPDETAAENPADSRALPPYFQSLVRQNQESGAATPDWEGRVRGRLAVLEAVLDDGNR